MAQFLNKCLTTHILKKAKFLYCLALYEKDISLFEELKHIASCFKCIIIKANQLRVAVKYDLTNFGKLTKGCLQRSKKHSAIGKVLSVIC